jgi:hypothetical protein
MLDIILNLSNNNLNNFNLSDYSFNVLLNDNIICNWNHSSFEESKQMIMYNK